MNAGQKTISWLRDEQLQVDTKWSVSRPNGFTWWPHRHAQHIDLVRDYDGPHGDKGYVVRIRTEFLRKTGALRVSGGDAVALDLLMSTASMSGLVHDPASGLIYLSSAVRVHEVIWEWMARLLSIAAMTQIADAQFLADHFGPILGAKSAASGHPSNGPRARPDQIAVAFPAMCHAHGQQPSQWSAEEFAEVLPVMQRPPAVMASGGGAGVTIEFPFVTGTSLFEIVADQAHPRVGNGLLVRQAFPVEHLGLSEAKLRQRALQENATEVSEDAIGYGFGSYCYRDGCIRWSGFFPNLAYVPGLLSNLFYSSAHRAAHMASVLASPGDASSSGGREAPQPASAIERLLRFLGGGR